MAQQEWQTSFHLGLIVALVVAILQTVTRAVEVTAGLDTARVYVCNCNFKKVRLRKRDQRGKSSTNKF